MHRFYNIKPHVEITQFTDSKIYQYCQNNMHNKVFADSSQSIDHIENYKTHCVIDAIQTEKMCFYYDALIKNHMDNLIYEMISICGQHEQMAICLVAINNEKLDIIENLMSAKFDFNVCLDAYFYGDSFGSKFCFIGYAIYYKKIKIVQCLLDNGIGLNILDKAKKYFLYYVRTFDDEIFDLIINRYPQYHQSLLIISIYNNKADWTKRLFDTSPNINIDQIQYYFGQPFNDNDNDNDKADSAIQTGLVRNINVDVLKLLVGYGLEINQQLFETIFYQLNVDVTDYLMTEYSEYHFVPTDELIMHVFLNMKIDMIKLLIKYNVDLSQIQHAHPLGELIESAEKCGLDPKIFLHLLLSWLGM